MYVVDLIAGAVTSFSCIGIASARVVRRSD